MKSLSFSTLLFMVLTHDDVIRGQVSHVTLGPFVEQQRAGVMVGSVAAASNIGSEVSAEEFKSLRYEFLDPSNLQTASLFTLNGQTGGVFTSAMIDREAVCEYMEECLLRFDVSVNSEFTAFLRIISVAVNITDVNDNVPTFPREDITLNIPEGNTAGVTYPLPNAVDKDSRQNSVVGYNLPTTTSAFELNVEKNLDDTFKLSLSVNTVLDREQRDRYLIQITARDGGIQPLTGTLNVHINVTDINDNAPEFQQMSYSYSVVENAPVGTVIGRVFATDLDAGMNARITYSFSPSSSRSKIQDLFAIDPDTGEIQIIAPLQFVSGNTFNVVIVASDNGFPRQANQAQLQLIIVDTGNNPPRAEFLPKNPLYDSTVLIAENAKIPTLVGTMKVEDNDPGVSGTVNCISSHFSFRVQKLEQSGFLVLLQKRLDREVEEKVNVTIACADAGAPPMTAMSTFSVIVGDVNDNAPVFSQHVYMANLSENAKQDIEVIKVSAQDFDKGINSQFFYYLHPRENEMFKLNSKTGALTSNMVFDREVNSEVSVIIKAIDEGDQAMTGTTMVMVQIMDENDNAPELETTDFHVMEGSKPNRRVGKLSAHDKDIGINAEVEFYMRAVNPDPPFTISQEGEIRTSSMNLNIDRELQSTYYLVVDLNDKGTPKMSSSATVTIHVLDANDNRPEVLFPNTKNNTIKIMWNHTPNTPFAHINATDPDDGDNAKLSYFIAGGNKHNLFEVSKDTGSVYLRRYIKGSDNPVQHVKIAVQDNGKPHQQETQAVLHVVINTTNATFARHEGPAEVERNILIVAIVIGATIVFSIVIVVVIIMIRSSGLRPRRAKDPSEWQRDKMGIQEECGKTEMEKVAWKVGHADFHKAPPPPMEPLDDMDEDEQDLCGGGGGGGSGGGGGASDSMLMGKAPGLSWSNSGKQRAGGAGGGSDPHLAPPGLDQYRKQDFYTFCKVRSPLDDVNSVTSGETTTSDSGRGGSEDDQALPPIAEVPPECGNGVFVWGVPTGRPFIIDDQLRNASLSLDRRSDRSTSPLSPVKTSAGSGAGGPFGSPETKILPLSSFREPENRRLYTNMKMAMNDPSGGLHPYYGDKVHPSSLKRNHYMNQPATVNLPGTNATTTGSRGGSGDGGSSCSSSYMDNSSNGLTSSMAGSNRSLPHNSSSSNSYRPGGSSGRQVTFAQSNNSKSLPRFEAGKRSPCPPAYEHLLPDGAGNYTSFSRGIDDDDGNTTTSGSYTLDNMDIEDSIS